MAPKWAKEKGEFQKRAGFVMMACLAAHDKTAKDAAFLKFFPIIEKGASDERNFVKKGVSWALRHLGHRSASAPRGRRQDRHEIVEERECDRAMGRQGCAERHHAACRDQEGRPPLARSA